MIAEKKTIEWAVVALVGVALGVGGFAAVQKAAMAAEEKRMTMDLNAQIHKATPAREVVVMRADATVIAGAAQNELLATKSEVTYVSRAKFTYLVDMRGLQPADYHYDATNDVLKVRIPAIKAESHPYGPRKRLATFGLMAFEGGRGNQLEQRASAALEANARAESKRPELLDTAKTAAKFEISKLYEEAFRGAGKRTKVVVVASGEPFPG